MKTLQLSIIAMVFCIVILPSVHNVKAIPYMSPQDLYKANETVFYGQVISKQAGPGPDYYYQIKVQTYFKNPQTSDSITVAGHKSLEGHVTYPQFEIGDKAIFYITKIDGINTISPYSQKAGDACDVNSFLGPGYFGSGNSHGGAASNPRITDVNGNVLERILTNQEIMLSYDDVWNNYPESRTIPASILIQNADNGKQVFNNTQNLQVQACNFAGNLKWNFTPTQIGNYVAKMDVDNKTKLEMGFSVIFDSSANSKIILSPLKQLKSGIAANNVKCQQDLQLVIKEEDGSPACVKPDTANILIKRGWASSITAPPHTVQQTSGNTTLPVSFEPCNTPYPKSNTGVAVLYMPPNSIGKICVRYSNPDDTPYPIGISFFDANNINKNATGITTWNDSGNNTISKGNSTIVYWINTGNQTGLYGLAFFCGDWNPFVVGYDNNSNMTAKDFPFLRETLPCPFEPYHLHIDSLTGIGVKHIQ